MITIGTLSLSPRDIRSNATIFTGTLSAPCPDAMLQLFFGDGEAPIGNLTISVVDAAGRLYGFATDPFTRASETYAIIRLAIPADGHTVRLDSDSASDSAVECSGTLYDVSADAAVTAVTSVLADPDYGLESLMTMFEDVGNNASSAASDASLLLTSRPIGPPKAPAGDRVAWWSQRSGTHYMARSGVNYPATGTATAADRHVLYTALAALPDGLLEFTVFRQSGGSPVPASDTPLGVIGLRKAGTSFTPAALYADDLAQIASGTTTAITNAELATADAVAQVVEDVGTVSGALSATRLAKIDRLPAAGVVATVGDVASGGGPFVDDPVPTGRLAKLRRTSAGLAAGGASGVTLKAGETAVLCGADFARDLPTNARVTSISGLTASAAGITVASIGVDHTVAKFTITAVTAGTYTLTVAVTYSQGGGTATGIVSVVVLA